jgi:CRISPR system Cascade subunit CasD
MKVLILRLEGPLMSFGDVAVDELRPTARHPFKSMIVGLLGNALGVTRLEGDVLEELQASFKMASRIDRPGRVMTDYQTVSDCPDE